MFRNYVGCLWSNAGNAASIEGAGLVMSMAYEKAVG